MPVDIYERLQRFSFTFSFLLSRKRDSCREPGARGSCAVLAGCGVGLRVLGGLGRVARAASPELPFARHLLAAWKGALSAHNPARL